MKNLWQLLRRLLNMRDFSKYKVVLVVGHSENERGASSKTNPVRTEYNFNKKVAENVAPLVSQFCNCHIIFREDGLKDVVKKVNAINPNLAISLHCNAFNGKASGSEVLYFKGSAMGNCLASLMLKQIHKALGLRNRGIKERSLEQRGGYFLGKTKCWAILLEPFFIDNVSDLNRADEQYEDLIKALSSGIRECLEFIDSGRQ
jgi:N-acetylmuramoyl-L-alanine amidase